jgi:membrane protease YdiL (CAAX protease family)
MIVERIKAFALRRPLLFVILLILSLLVVEILAGFLAVVLFNLEQADPIFALAILLITTLYLGFILWAFKWLKVAGLAFLGSWKGWGVTLVLLIYYLLELEYSFFGEVSFTVPSTAVNGLRLPGVFIGAMFEEVLFRGVILYTLVCVWGATRKGVLKAVVVSTLFFGGIHAINSITGDAREVLGQIAIALFEGVWWAAIVLRWGSIWPVVFIHGITNWVLQTKALSFADYHGTVSSYVLAVLLGLPLVTLGIWWIFRASLCYQRHVSNSYTLAKNGDRDTGHDST